MLIQWHLLMARLQQSDEAYESLAADMGDAGTQSEPPTTKVSQSGIALKKLHQKLWNTGFQQFVEMKQATLLAKAAYKVASKPQTKTEVAKELNADIQAPPELDSDSKMHNQKDTLTQAEQSPQVVNNDKERFSANDPIEPSLLIAFKQSLPIPSNAVWQQLEIHYLQQQSRQQLKLVSSLSGVLKGIVNEQLQQFLDGINEFSNLHVVQALLAKLLSLISVQEAGALEVDVPTEPEED